MKGVLITAAMAIVLSIFTVFQFDNDTFSRQQELLKYAADDCSEVAVLYYDPDRYAEGIKIFNKEEGNRAIAFILRDNLNLNEDLTSNNPYLKGEFKYYTYYFDGNGRISVYDGDRLINQENDIEYPHLFQEDTTGFQEIIYEPTVIVTIDAGKFDFRLGFLDDPDCIRTSGYEYVENH